MHESKIITENCLVAINLNNMVVTFVAVSYQWSYATSTCKLSNCCL